MAVSTTLHQPRGCGGLGSGRRTQRPAVAALRCQASAGDRGGPAQPQKGESDRQVLRGATLLLAAALSAQAAAPQAAAARTVAWEPRRHYRRLPRVVPDLEEAEQPVVQQRQQQKTQQQAGVIDKAPAEQQEAPGDLKSQFTEMQRSAVSAAGTALQKARAQYHTASSRLGGAYNDTGAGEWVQSVSAPARRYVPAGVPPAAAQWAGLAATAAGAGLALWLLFKKLLPAIFGASRPAQGGRYVRDRGLGGREVFVPDAPARPASSPAPAPPSQQQQQQQQQQQSASRQRRGRLPDSRAVQVPESGTRVITVGGRRRPSTLAQEPEWWSQPRPPTYVHPSQKEQAEQEAKRVLRTLQDAKLSGQSYPTSALVELRETCQAADVTVKAANDSTRDSIFRSAVNMALKASLQETNTKLAGLKPQQFVAGLAKDLGVSMSRAVQIVHAEVASRVRTMIINACAARRAGNTPEEMNQLLRLAALLTRFPLPRGSAEGEVIASSIAARCWLSERQAAFLTYGAMEPGTASLMAELLGFDPELVLPQLEMYTRNQ